MRTFPLNNKKFRIINFSFLQSIHIQTFPQLSSPLHSYLPCHPSPHTPHISPLPLFPHSSLLTPTSSPPPPFTPHPSPYPLTPHPSFFTPLPSPSLFAPHSSLLTPHTSHLTSHPSHLTPHTSPLTLNPHPSPLALFTLIFNSSNPSHVHSVMVDLVTVTV